MLTQTGLTPVPHAIRVQHPNNEFQLAMSAFKQGQPIVVASSVGCDVMVLASQVTTDSTAFLIRYGTGFITVAMSADRLAELDLPALPIDPGMRRDLALHVAVDASAGVTTGISARDRALTIRLLGESTSNATDFTRPGHVMPVRANLESNVPPGPVETAAMAALVAADTVETAICSLTSETDPACIAQAPEGELLAHAHGIPFVRSAEVTRMFYRRLLMQEVDAL